MPRKTKSKSTEDMLKIDPRLLWRIIRRTPQYTEAADRFVDGARKAGDQIALNLYESTASNSTLDLFPEAVGPSEPRNPWGFAVPPLPISGDGLLSEYRLNPNAQFIRTFQQETLEMFSFPIHPDNSRPDYDVMVLCWNFYPAARVFREEKCSRPFGFLEGMHARDAQMDVITIRLDHRFPKTIIQEGCRIIVEDYLATRGNIRGFLRVNDRDSQEGSTLAQKIECWELRKEGISKIEAFDLVWRNELNLTVIARKKRVDNSVRAIEKLANAIWQPN